MKDALKAFMRVGTIHHVSYPFSGNDEALKLSSLKRLLTDDYFDAIEVGRFADPATRARAIAMIREAHIDRVAFGGQGITLGSGLNPNDLDPTKRRQAADALKAGIDEAYEFGASFFAFLAGRFEEATVEESFDALSETAAELCAYARERGSMGVEIEVFDYDIDKRSLIGPAPRVARLAESLSGRFGNFSVQIDSSHIPLLHESIEESILPVKRHIRHVHMGNAVMGDPSAPAYGDNHPRFGFPGGENDTEQLAAYLRALLEIGFLNETDRPIVSFEVKPQAGEDPDLVLAGAKRALNAAWLLA